MTNEEALKVADEGRNSISNYCINKCEAKCCRAGQLLLQSEQEVHAIVGAQKKPKLLQKKVLQKTEQGNYTFDYKKFGGPCPKLTNDNLCSIHKDPKRPRICGDFPLFVFKNYYSLATKFCPAADEGLLDNYCKKLDQLGFKRI